MEAFDLLDFFDVYPAAVLGSLGLASALSLALLVAVKTFPLVPLAILGAGTVFAASYFAVRHGLGGSHARLRGLSPERITSYRASDAGAETSPEKLARSIIERATEMNNVLQEDRSAVRAEMCALGYRRCANDMISLTHLVNEEMKDASLGRRIRLNRIRKRAVEALSKVRKSLPPDALKATRQER